MFSYGFTLDKGSEEFPTQFALKRKKWIVDDISENNSYILMFEGNIFNTSDVNYVLSYEKNTNWMGYND